MMIVTSRYSVTRHGSQQCRAACFTSMLSRYGEVDDQGVQYDGRCLLEMVASLDDTSTTCNMSAIVPSWPIALITKTTCQITRSSEGISKCIRHTAL
jgi:hypothetical protein